MDEESTKPNNSEETERLKAERDEYLNGWKRAKADYVNLQKETESKLASIAGFARAEMLLGLIPILDNFGKAVSHVSEEQKKEAWVVGIFHIKKQLEDFLHSNGLEKIATVGEKFDPNLHEAVGREKAEGKEDEILQEVRSGYKLNGKVIVPAKVIVGE